MLHRILLAILLIAQFHAGFAHHDHSVNQPKSVYSYRIMSSPNQTFGYQIYKGKKMMIEQPTIPGVSGSHGFVNEKQARLVAKQVIQKLNKGIFPPQVSPEELKRLGITFQP